MVRTLKVVKSFAAKGGTATDDTAEASTAEASTAKSGTAEAGTVAASTAKAGKITGTQAEITNCLRVVLFICVRLQQVITASRNKTLQNHLQYRCVQFMHSHFQYKKHISFV